MRFFIFLSLISFSSVCFSQTTLTQDQLNANLSDSLDAIITCGEDPVIISSSPFGVLLGKWLRLSWARSPYYDSYIDPLIESVRTNQDRDFRELSEYQVLLEMTQKDPEFASCPEKTPAFIFALDSLLESL